MVAHTLSASLCIMFLHGSFKTVSVDKTPAPQDKGATAQLAHSPAFHSAATLC